jgi:hypothetical protein
VCNNRAKATRHQGSFTRGEQNIFRLVAHATLPVHVAAGQHYHQNHETNTGKNIQGHAPRPYVFTDKRDKTDGVKTRFMPSVEF